MITQSIADPDSEGVRYSYENTRKTLSWITDFIIVCQNLIGQYLRKSNFNFGGKFEFRSYASYHSCNQNVEENFIIIPRSSDGLT